MERVCVFCGSSPGTRPEYGEAAEALGHALVKAGLGLVYGGASVGLMGWIADTVLAGNGEVIGVIPESMAKKEIAHGGLSDLRVVGSMHERKATMADLASGFIALPGGLGTFEELFEILTWAQLGMHKKPIGLLNVGGYYDPLMMMLDRAVGQQFVRPEHRGMLLVSTDPDALLVSMTSYKPMAREKWINAEET